jgi:hypothetical protein
MMTLSSMLWRRVDTPGHDACRLERGDSGFRLRGTTIFRHENGPARLSYSVECDARWHTLSGSVEGFLGDRSLEHAFVREGGIWVLDGNPVSGLNHLFDLDFSFTPATNIQQLRRVKIAQGEAVHLPVAWFDVESGALMELPQTYERRGPRTFWYQAPSAGYEGMLELGSNGFVRRYPNLWEAE